MNTVQEPPPARMSSSRLTLASIVVGLGLFVFLAWYLVDPAPPSKISIATGSPGGFYESLGKRFQLRLAYYGIDATLIETAGSRENLGLLSDPDGPVDVAFVQGGVRPNLERDAPVDSPLNSLATLAVEPLWLFSRSEGDLTQFLDGGPMRVAAGAEGSGTRDLVVRLFSLMGVGDNVELVALGGEAAERALMAGEVDFTAYVTSPRTPWVDRLMRAPGINVVETNDFSAIARHLSFVVKIDLPRRVIDFARDIPPADKTIFGVSTGLIVRSELHPAIKQVLLQVSSETSRGSRLLGTYGDFPSRDYTEFPVDPEAVRYFTYGPTLLRRYLPFWAANLFERFWVLIIPIVTLLIPIVRFGPSTVVWGIRRRIWRHYKELREIEEAVRVGDAQVARMALEDLDRMEASVRAIVVPLGFRDDLYRLRMQVVFVREQLRESLRSREGDPVADPAPGDKVKLGGGV